MPTSTTCYFTLGLPQYSSYEILNEKLKYAIHNCNSIDADFVPDDNEEQLSEIIWKIKSWINKFRKLIKKLINKIMTNN